MTRYIIQVFLALFSSLPVLQAQVGMEVVPSAYGLKNGLADNNITDGLFDEKNHLWLATSNGLSCFDGQYFITYNNTDSNFKISNSSVNSLARIGSAIYAATIKGIDKIDAETKKAAVFYSSATGENIVTIFATRQGQLIGVSAKGICRNLFTGKYLQLPFQATEYFIAEDENRNLYISSFQKNYCVISLGSHKQTAYVIKRDVPNYGLVYKKSQGLLSLQFQGVFKNNLITKKDEPFILSNDIVNGLTEIDSSHFLTIHDFNKIFLHDQVSASASEIKILQTKNAIYKKLLIDNNGAAVLLTNTGIYCFKLPLRFQTLVPDGMLSDQRMVMVRRAMLELPNSNIALFSYRGIQEYNPASGATKIMSINPLVFYTAVLDGTTIWIGTDGKGLFKYNYVSKKIEPAIRTDLGLSAEHIFSICKEPDGKLLLGYFIPFGLREYDPVTYKMTEINFTYGNIVPAQSRISHISRDETGHYWIATDKGLFELDSAKRFLFRYDASANTVNQRLPANGVNYCCHISAAQVWLATDNGIVLLNKQSRRIEQSLGVKENLAGEKCISISEDRRHRLWITSYKGLSCLVPVTGRVYNFYKEDGLPDDEYNYMASLQSTTGMLYFGGLNGVVKIDPDKWNDIGTNPSLHFLLLQKEGEKGELELISEESGMKGLKILRSKEVVEFRFGFCEFINPGYCKYWYRIKGLSETWTALGNTGHLRLWNLPAGNYTVQIRGDNAKGVSAEKFLELPLTVVLPFYQTSFFKFIIVLIVIAVIFLFLWQRYRDQKAIRNIKAGMLNDIHDEVGSILTKTAMKAELLNLKFGNEVKELQEIQQYSREAIQSLRNLLWSISSEKMSTQEFEDRIHDWLHFLFSDTGYKVQFKNKIPDASFIDSVEVRRNIILIIKELAHNTLKHATGDEFNIVLDKSGRKYLCVISDNGKNSDSDINFSGYGLKSIENRVKIIGGSVTFQKNTEGFKTKIIF